MLEVENLHLHAGTHPVACGYSVQFHPGEVTAIIGPNGCGKTSLMRALFGELHPSAGHIRLNGDDQREERLPVWRQRFGYMPQDTRLDLDLSTLEVVMLGRLDRLGMRVDDDTVLAALNALEAVGLLHIAERPIYALSGGQRQMALFAQVLLRSPEVMMLDEPVSALDMRYQVVLMDHLHKQTRAHNWITVTILHDLNLAAQYADRLVVLDKGKLQAYGPPAEVITAELIQRLYDVPVDVQIDRFGHPHVRTIRYQAEDDAGRGDDEGRDEKHTHGGCQGAPHDGVARQVLGAGNCVENHSPDTEVREGHEGGESRQKPVLGIGFSTEMADDYSGVDEPEDARHPHDEDLGQGRALH